MANTTGKYEIVLSTKLDTKQIRKDLQNLEKMTISIQVRISDKSLEKIKELNKILNETKALNKFVAGLQNIQKTMQSYEKVAGQVLRTTENLASATQKTTKEVKTFGDRVQDAFAKFSLWSVVSTLFYQVVDSIRQLVNTAIELDKSFTELTKVTDLTIDDFDELTQKAYDLGSELAKTTKEVIDAMTEFAKAGYSVEESTDILAKNALMWTNISDGTVSASEAANMMISVMKAFKMEAEDTTHIIDALNEVNELAFLYSNI